VTGGETLGFIGAGNMAEALVRGLTASLVPPSRVIVSDRDHSRLLHMAESCEVKVCSKNYELARDADIIFLTVKPADVAGVLVEIAPELGGDKLLISVAAGVTTARILAILAESGTSEVVPLVRAMPNTPVTVGEGMTAIVAGAGAGSEELERAAGYFSTVGKVITLEDEALMDAVTALSGSGPAYVFYIMECLMEAARIEGLGPDDARTLVMQTVFGAAKLAAGSGDGPGELRRKVTSPGGTTAAALKVFEESGLCEIIKKAVNAARKRSEELSEAL